MNMNSPVLLSTDLPLPLLSRGKVRDSYELGDRLLIIATDRISAFDFILPSGIPDKGSVLNQLSAFWFGKTRDVISNHLLEPVDDVQCLDAFLPAESRFAYPSYLAGRSMVVKKVNVLPVECVVRGYIAGSAWEEYHAHGTVNGASLPQGLQQSQKLPELLFTPTTKAEAGHDMPLTIEEFEKLVGKALADEMKQKSMDIYNLAQQHASARGIIIADTKMEYGIENGKLILIDELLTPDSSRFWDSSLYMVGQSQPSYDKQPVRDWLAQSGWNKEPPVPELPEEIVKDTSRIYRHAYQALTGSQLNHATTL